MRRTGPALAAAVALACGPGGEWDRYRGDLDGMHERGVIRFLMPAVGGIDGLPRGRTPLEAERRLAARFAETHGLEAVWVPVESYDQLIPALLDGRGDVIVANYTVTPERQREIAFGRPFVHVREVVVAHADSAPIASGADLAGRTIVVRR
ncbi:MAG: transporter substrate-binding domain-containing protein, partial [Synechococcaceae cyanobacterium]|nr:transporter substrate-binding domain-containing protein [Synechococcaceae cyanobacterium]